MRVALDAVRAHAVVQHLLAHRRLVRVARRVRRRAPAAAARPAADPAGSCRGCSPMIHLPRVTGDVRSGFDVVTQERALARAGPRRVSMSGPSVTRRNWLP